MVCSRHTTVLVISDTLATRLFRSSLLLLVLGRHEDQDKRVRGLRKIIVIKREESGKDRSSASLSLRARSVITSGQIPAERGTS